jgi:transcriptional regulator with PAS, ATPase and Fis domain
METEKKLHHPYSEATDSARIKDDSKASTGKSYLVTGIEDTHMKLVKAAQAADMTILITGETGTGKEGAARIIHEASNRREGPFITVNAAAVPETLFVAELFGHEKGAYTGAETAKGGLLEAAEKGTLFIDEIGELSLALQAQLLRVLQDKEGRRVGSSKLRKYDVRFVAATNQNIYDETKFRKDVRFRFPFEIILPPLHKRPGAVPELAHHFVATFSNGEKRLEDLALDYLCSKRWPGNIRELENFLQVVCIFAKDMPGNLITIGDLIREDILQNVSYAPVELAADVKRRNLLKEVKEKGGLTKFLTQVEVDMIRKTVEETGSHEAAAKKLGIHLSILKKRLKLALKK